MCAHAGWEGCLGTWNPEVVHLLFAWELQGAGLWPWFPWQWATSFCSLLFSGPADSHGARGFGPETENGEGAPSDSLNILEKRSTRACLHILEMRTSGNCCLHCVVELNFPGGSAALSPFAIARTPPSKKSVTRPRWQQGPDPFL